MSHITIKVDCGTVSIAHQLHLEYQSKCNFLHGHNYKVQVELSGPADPKTGMVIDFTHIKEIVQKYDHSVLGRIYDTCGKEVYFNKQFLNVDPSTAEKFAHILRDEINLAANEKNSSIVVVAVHCWETDSTEVIC